MLRFDPLNDELWLHGKRVWGPGEERPDEALLEWLDRHPVPAELPAQLRARLRWWRQSERPYQPFPSLPCEVSPEHEGWEWDLLQRRWLWARWPHAVLPAGMPLRQVYTWGEWGLLEGASILLYHRGELLHSFPSHHALLPADCPPQLAEPLRQEPFTPWAAEAQGAPARSNAVRELVKRLAVWSLDPLFRCEVQDEVEEVPGALVLRRGRLRWLLLKGRTLEVGGAPLEELRPYLGPVGPLSDLWAKERLGVCPPVQRVLALSERYKVVVGPRSGQWLEEGTIPYREGLRPCTGGRWRRLWSASDLEVQAVAAFLRAHPRDVAALALLAQWVPATARDDLTKLLARAVGCAGRAPTMQQPVAWVGESLVYLAYGEGLVALTPQGALGLGPLGEEETPLKALQRRGYPSLEAAVAAARLVAL
ncbi:hypothetical protein [Calidithermus roseus]|uniref:Uncharacterized protein n=1 Tax=Calidithermus roseus TaxID=1644118 RepID=A0A399EKE7_9DEIN|nr:hypothetical protein [Calidithermus roseus]RIH83569.1 hypothetical protein Mrose_02991 [Calidithermus roseus]